MGRRGQNAGNSAILIAAITALIVAYILFLPQDQRNDLLGPPYPGGTGGTGGTGTSGGLAQPIVLLSENVGTVSVSRTNTLEHSILSVKIMTRTNAEELKRVGSLYIKKGTFDEETKEVKFSIAPEATGNVKLSFSVRSGKGRLVVLLNGEELLNKEVSGSVEPIVLEGLSSNNVLTFKVSNPGSFWSANEYRLENVLIAGDVTDYSKSSADQYFSMAKTEYANLEKAELKFTPACDGRDALSVFLNSRQVFNGLPRCGAVNSIEIGRSLLAEEENTLSFVSGGGVVDITGIKLKSYLNKPIETVYYFTIPTEWWNYVLTRQADGVLTLSFPVDGIKQGTLNINGYKATFKTNDVSYTVRVTSYLKEGTNSIVITPAGDTLEIAELKVALR